MTTVPTGARPAPAGAPPLPVRRPGPAVTFLAVRFLRWGTLIVAGVVAGMSAMVAMQYRSIYGDAYDASSLQALAGNPAIRVLFGRPVALDDPGGFTVWRVGWFVAVVVGVWSLLTATRITRGEEDAGRWELLLAGRVRLSRLVAGNLAVLVAALGLVGAALAAAMVAAGTQVTGSLLYGAAVALIGVGFAAVGALAAQLVPDRRAAAGLAAAVLGAGLLLRMVGDGAEGLGWLHWVSPFGLLALVQPYAADRVAPLLVLAVAGAALVAVAVAGTRGRDLGAGRVRVRDSHPARTLLLRSLPRFALWRVARPLAGWAAGLGAYFLLIGLLAASMNEFLRANPRFAELAAAAGFADLGTVEGYVASLFSLVAIPVGLFAASRVAADEADEEARRFTLLFAAPVARTRWATLQAGVVGVACVLLAVVAGLATWVGTSTVGAGLGLWPALAGVLNAVPVALLCLGAALLALGWLPRAVFPVGALPAVGGFLLQVLADSLGWPAWVRRLSPFTHLGSVPADPPDWPGTAGILAVFLVLGVVGALGYARRDLRG
jgi:ABC-2 type transport system permease protein